MSDTIHCTHASPCGAVEVEMRGERLARICLGGEKAAGSGRYPRVARPVIQALDRYFDGEEAELPPPLMDLSGVSAFQRRVFERLMGIGRGELVTYGELAGRVGNPRAARAVGGAMGRNPLPIFIPCHRVVAAGRRPGGFGAGMRWKKELLALEGWIIREGRLCRKKPER
jgi:methylated-DNA-[protein]-cysteine S-methyltransferase